MEQIILSGVTVEQLREMMVDTFKEMFALKEQVQNLQIMQQPSEFITRKEAAKLLHISLPTLNEWTKDGTLKSYRVGTRILYKPDEVLASVTQRNFTNCSRKQN